VSALSLVGALGLGAAFGYGAQRGAFCMNSGFRNAIAGDWTKLKALALAVAVQLLALPVVFWLGLAQPAPLPLRLWAALAGGLLFGFSMRWAGACAAGVWYKLGAGDVGALLALVGMALGATVAESGPLSVARIALQQTATDPWMPAPIVSFAAGLLALAVLARAGYGRAGQWSWRRTGLWIGFTAVLAWPVSAAYGRRFGLAVVPGTVGIVSGVGGGSFPAWDAILVLGLLVGGWLGARRSGPVELTAPRPALLLQRFAGGLGLGIGASIATGCTVGQGLTGLGLLAPSSFVVMGAIFGGRAMATLMSRRFDHSPTAMTPLPVRR
jgi:uncharacterized membrane protein YedE/YeeE